jgi:hypothetical protein
VVDPGDQAVRRLAVSAHIRREPVEAHGEPAGVSGHERAFRVVSGPAVRTAITESS